MQRSQVNFPASALSCANKFELSTLMCLYFAFARISILVFYMWRQLSSIGKMHNFFYLQLYNFNSTAVDQTIFLKNIVVKEHQIQYIGLLLDE